MLYILKSARRHGKWEYFMGWNAGKVVITLDRAKAKLCNETEANKIIMLLNGPYTKYEKELVHNQPH